MRRCFRELFYNSTIMESKRTIKQAYAVHDLIDGYIFGLHFTLPCRGFNSWQEMHACDRGGIERVPNYTNY